MRDVNAPVLASAAEACGARVIRFPIVPDRYDALLATVRAALESCDMVLVSGGSSAGQKDNTERVLSELGEMLFHGIAVKPGKPTMCADVDGVPVFGLPGHPVAAYFMFLELVRPLLAGDRKALSVAAKLSAGVPSNHGRSELVPVRLEQRDGQVTAVPIRGKSGLISQLSRADGFFAVGRNLEGLAAGVEVDVRMFS
jgi:molybdopterin molybdotransferase